MKKLLKIEEKLQNDIFVRKIEDVKDIDKSLSQTERMYSEEDMEKAFTNGLNRSFDSDFDRWFEQFKKK